MSTIVEKKVLTKDHRTVVIRSGFPADAPQILEHAHAIMAEGEFTLSTPEDFHMTEEQEAAWLQTHYEDPNKVVIVAESEGQIIGLISFHTGERKRIAHQGSFSISVNRAWRDQRIGRTLLSTLLLWTQQNQAIEKVCLGVFSNNTRAIALYTDLGFVEEGRLLRQIKMGPEVYVDEILMGKWIKE